MNKTLYKFNVGQIVVYLDKLEGDDDYTEYLARVIDRHYWGDPHYTIKSFATGRTNNYCEWGLRRHVGS